MIPSNQQQDIVIKRISFNRNEFAGAFGDIGTDLPLIMGMIVAGQLDAAGVLVMFGISQIITGWWYRLPMAVQPLKVMAALVIANHISASVLYAGGLVVGIMVLLLTVTGLIDIVARIVPKAVVRGIQFGLGLKLALIAVTDFMGREGVFGYILALVAFVLIVILFKNKRWPASLVVIALGAFYAVLTGRMSGGFSPIGLALPQSPTLHLSDVFTGLFVLALPQLPLSLGNSILATSQLANDLYPYRNITVRKIGLTYGLMNIFNALLGGIPVCHGSGGLAGHHTFGGRTGGSVIIYGLLYLVSGLFFSESFGQIVNIFPFPILGAILLFEGLALVVLLCDLGDQPKNFTIACLVGILANALPYGFLTALVIGTGVHYFWKYTKTKET